MIAADLFKNRPDEVNLELTRHTSGGSSACSVVLNEEHELKLYRDGELLHTFVCSPSELGELCAGWLYSEGFFADEVEVSKDGRTARAHGALPRAAEPKPIASQPSLTVSADEMLALFSEASGKYARSHGIHECVLKGADWYILRTDIGRHNAIDKAVGAALIKGYDMNGAVMFSSGRINERTVKKAVRCGVTCLMSKAVITRQALDLAEKLGLKILFSVKQDSFITKL